MANKKAKTPIIALILVALASFFILIDGVLNLFKEIKNEFLVYGLVGLVIALVLIAINVYLIVMLGKNKKGGIASVLAMTAFIGFYEVIYELIIRVVVIIENGFHFQLLISRPSDLVTPFIGCICAIIIAVFVYALLISRNKILRHVWFVPALLKFIVTFFAFGPIQWLIWWPYYEIFGRFAYLERTLELNILETLTGFLMAGAVACVCYFLADAYSKKDKADKTLEIPVNSSPEFTKAVTAFKKAGTVKAYEKTIKMLEAIPEQAGVPELTAKCNVQIEKLNVEKEKMRESLKAYRKPLIKAAVIGLVIALVLAIGSVVARIVDADVIQPANDYKEAVKLMEEGDLDTAKMRFEWLEGYKDSEDMVKECDYRAALLILENENYYSAKTAFEALGDYKESKEKLALCEAEILKAQQKEAYEDALDDFTFGSYKTPSLALEYFQELPEELGNVKNLRKAFNVLKAVEKWKDPEGYGMTIGVDAAGYDNDKEINILFIGKNGPDKEIRATFKVTVDSLCAAYPIVIKNADTTITITADSLTYDYANADPALAITGKIYNQFQ